MADVELPSNWVIAALEELIVFVIGGDWGQAADYPDPGYVDVRCIRASEVRNWATEKGSTAARRRVKKASLETRRLRRSDIVIEISGGGPDQPVGRTLLIDDACLAVDDTPAICTNFFRLIRPSSLLRSSYLNWFLQYFYSCRDMGRYQGGSNNLRNLKFDQYLTINVPIPPVDEQRRIVAKIEELFSELDKGVESLTTAREQLKVYRQAVLKHAFGGKLTADWRDQNKEDLEETDWIIAQIERCRKSYYNRELGEWKQGKARKPKGVAEIESLGQEELKELSDLPKQWKWVRWGDILSVEEGAFRRGPFGSALKKELFVKQGPYKVYEQYCPINDDCSFERYFVTEEKFTELQAFSVVAGDFLISCSGVTLGRITRVPNGARPGIINQALLRVRLNAHVYDAEFFQYLFRSHYFQRRIFDNSTGTAIPNVKGVNELKDIAVPLCSLTEQRQIVREIQRTFSVIDRQNKELDEALSRSKSLRQAILKIAFSGQLVAQDPSDEPASKLLERIRTQKQENVKVKRRKELVA